MLALGVVSRVQVGYRAKNREPVLYILELEGHDGNQSRENWSVIKLLLRFDRVGCIYVGDSGLVTRKKNSLEFPDCNRRNWRTVQLIMGNSLRFNVEFNMINDEQIIWPFAKEIKDEVIVPSWWTVSMVRTKKLESLIFWHQLIRLLHSLPRTNGNRSLICFNFY